MDLGAKRRVGGGFAWLYCPFHLCVCVCVCMSVARYSAAGSEGYVEFEGSRGCRLRMVVGFARLEGLRGWRTNYLWRRCPVDLCACVCICV